MLDFIFLISLAIFLFRGYRKGFVIALFSFFSIIIGIIGAMKLSGTIAASLFTNHPLMAKWSPLLSYIIVFFIIVWIVKIVGAIIQKSLHLVALGFVNRIAGAILYGIAISLIFSVFIWLFMKMNFLTPQTLNDSTIVALIEPFAPYFFELISGIFPFVKSSFGYLNSIFDQLNTKIT